MTNSKDTQEGIIKIIEKTLKDTSIDPENYFFKEADFADALGVGRSTIREAITSLEIRGMVKRIHGRGIKAIDKSVEAVSNSIRDMLMRNDFEYNDVLQFRNILEVNGAGLAAVTRSKKHLKKMAQCIETMNDQVSYKAYLDADFSFHREVMKATQNKMLIAMIDAYSRVIRYAIEMSTDVDYRPEVDHHFHKNILDAITAQDTVGSQKCMAEHLRASTQNVDTLRKLSTISW